MAAVSLNPTAAFSFHSSSLTPAPMLPLCVRRLLCLFLISFEWSSELCAAPLLHPKVMIVSTFEIGADTGDKPGEFQFWVEREHLTNSLVVRGVDRPIRFRDDGLFGCVSGTTVRSAEQILLLGLDDRFDFTHTYWLINGIAGVNPATASVGSAAWARWVVDGDLGYELDGREIPDGWPYGLIPLGGKTPNVSVPPPAWAPKPMAWELDRGLVNWAFSLSRSIIIPDSPEAAAHRLLFTNWPAAQQPPGIFIGDSLASGRYWHGLRQNQWAIDWVRIQTGGQGEFAMTNMEDHGLMSALHRLAKIGRVDVRRALVLRTGSNYSVPRPGQSAAESLQEEYQGMRPALEAAYLTGSAAVHALMSDWIRFQDTIPVSPDP